MTNTLVDQVTAGLARTPGVSDWRLRQVETVEHQLYLIGAAPESARTVRRTELEVVVYNDHPPHSAPAAAQPVRGSSSVTLLPGDRPAVDAKLRDAVFMASLADNPRFALPGPADYPAVASADPALLRDPAATLRELGDTIQRAVAAEPDVRLSSAEIYLRDGHTSLRNSRGAAGAYRGTSLALDWVLIAGHGRDEAERHASTSRRRRADLDLAGELARAARQARDSRLAGLPQARTGPVVISGPALREFFSPVMQQTGGEFHYQRLTPLQVGQPIYRGPLRGDALTYLSDGLLPYGTHTAPFDSDGVPRQSTVLVQDGILRALWAAQHHAEYLGIPATGAFANARLLPGATPQAELLAGDDVTHVVAFSWLNPDPVTGNFSGEIRLAYQRRHQEWVPVKGGAVSGNVFAALADAHFSAETQFLGDYLGPAAIRFGELVVAGE